MSAKAVVKPEAKRGQGTRGQGADSLAGEVQATGGETEVRPAVRLKELVERVSAATGERKQVVRPVVAATIAALNAALARGEELNLPPLGRLRVQRSKETPRGQSLVLRLRRGSGAGNPAEPLAAVDEES